MPSHYNTGRSATQGRRTADLPRSGRTRGRRAPKASVKAQSVANVHAAFRRSSLPGRGGSQAQVGQTPLGRRRGVGGSRL